MNIFISYTIKDKEISFDSLSSISRKLKHIGNVYIDIINNDSIKQNAYKEVLNKYSWDTVSSQILNFYVQAIANYEKK